MPSVDDSVFIEFGTANQGKTFYFDSTTTAWKEAQQKTKVNQQPLFGMFDNDHVSFDDATTYPNSTFLEPRFLNLQHLTQRRQTLC